MKRRRAVSLALPVAVLTGCGHAGDGGQPPAAYAHQACTAVATFEASLTAQAATYQAKVTAAKGAPVTLRTLASGFLQQQVTGSATLVAALQRLVAPSGHGGPQVKGALVLGAGAAHRTFVGQLAAVRRSDPADPATFFQVLNTAQQQVQTAGEAIANGIEGVGQYGDSAVNHAFAADGVCGNL